MEDAGLELNIVSAPAAAISQRAGRSKKRGSGKAWDKKKNKRGEGLGSQQGQQQQQHGSTSDQAVQARQQPPSDGSNAAAPPMGDGGSPLASNGVQSGGESPARATQPRNRAAAVAADGSTSVNKSSKGVDAGGAPKAAASSQGVNAPVRDSAKARHRSDAKSSKTASGPVVPEEVSNERQRVLGMAGRDATRRAPPAPAKPQQQPKAGTKPKSATAAATTTPENRSAKRKRPTGSPGPVAHDGVIDFTVGDSTPSKKRADPEKSRRAAATATAVAKATAAMAKAGSKWWDDDDDDHVVAAKVTNAAPFSDRNKLRWNNYGIGGGGGGGGWGADGGEEEVEVDQDGGLPSDVHPNSVRTKAVDVGGEASNAMGILAALLEKGGGGGREESRRVKNGGKSKKKAKEPTEPVEGEDGSTAPVAQSNSADSPHAMELESRGTDDEKDMDAGVTQKEDGAEKQKPPVEPASGVGVGSGGSERGGGLGSRKNRGRANVSGEDTSVPAPEYHARPRELSRRAVAKPLPSARSAHVMAAGATFAALGMPPNMVSHLEEPKGDMGGGGMGLVGPTVCQLAAVPVLAAGHNTVIKSETGSGKTLAYLLPMLCDLAATEPRVEREKGTLAIVLAPTRELSAQILEVLTRVVRPFIWLVPGSISGGERRKSEKARLRKGVTVLVCTPGRLLDHLKSTKCFRREWLRWLILDEADRLLDMGFEKQVKEIVELLDQSARAVRSGPAGGSRVQGGEVVPSVKVIRRQTVMVSATLEKGVSRMAAVLLSKHMRVDTDVNVVESVDESGKAKLISGERRAPDKKNKGDGLAPLPVVAGSGVHSADPAAGAAPAEEFSTPRQLVQYYMTVTQKLRLPALCSFLRARAREKVVVFMSTCDAVDFHHDLFRRAGWPGDTASRSAASTSVAMSSDGDIGGDISVEGVRVGAAVEKGAGEGGGAEKGGKKQAAAKAADSEFFGGGCLVRRLHGNVPQAERQATYRAFGAAKSGVLICTDVAARGLDLPTVDWIVQYDPPAETADYVHRVGRTARKGERGHSLLFLLPREAAYLGVLEARGLRPKPLSLEGVLCAADAGKRDARRADEQLAYELQQGLQLLVAGDKPLLDRARAAFQSHVRAYAARAPDSRTIFQVRSLHLGHVARSFALKDPPTAVKVGKRVVRRPGENKGAGRSGEGGGGSRGAVRGEKRRRDGAGGAGGSVHKLGLSKKTELASRSEFL